MRWPERRILKVFQPCSMHRLLEFKFKFSRLFFSPLLFRYNTELSTEGRRRSLKVFFVNSPPWRRSQKCDDQLLSCSIAVERGGRESLKRSGRFLGTSTKAPANQSTRSALQSTSTSAQAPEHKHQSTSTSWVILPGANHPHGNITNTVTKGSNTTTITNKQLSIVFDLNVCIHTKPIQKHAFSMLMYHGAV